MYQKKRPKNLTSNKNSINTYIKADIQSVLQTGKTYAPENSTIIKCTVELPEKKYATKLATNKWSIASTLGLHTHFFRRRWASISERIWLSLWTQIGRIRTTVAFCRQIRTFNGYVRKNLRKDSSFLLELKHKSFFILQSPFNVICMVIDKWRLDYRKSINVHTKMQVKQILFSWS